MTAELNKKLRDSAKRQKQGIMQMGKFIKRSKLLPGVGQTTVSEFKLYDFNYQLRIPKSLPKN